jgi:PIN domain nuclease of toxin-antitoxin system
MRFLLDTHILLCGLSQPEGLSQRAGKLLADDANEFVFSAVNMWEIAVKRALGRPDFPTEAATARRQLLVDGFFELVMTSEHAIFAASLPQIHKDPFDRLLVSQATVEGIMLLTSDRIVAKYPGPIQLV